MAYLSLPLASQSNGTFSATLMKVLTLRALERSQRKRLCMENKDLILPVRPIAVGTMGKGKAGVCASITMFSVALTENTRLHDGLKDGHREQTGYYSSTAITPKEAF